MDDEQRSTAAARRQGALKHRMKAGAERLAWEDDKRERQKWSSAQCLAILKALDKLLRTTGTMSDLRLLPESGNITLHTSGN